MYKNLLKLRYAYQPSIKFTHVQPSTQYTPIKMTVREAINLAMDEELAHDPNVFLLGEEVGQYQGAYKVSKGLFQKYGGDRVIDTPITEAGFTGIAVGAALYGLKPIVEFMTWNFAMQAIDHIINSAAKAHYMSAGDQKASIVFRGINGATAYVAAQHSQCFASWYSNVPGLVVLAPFDCDDAKSLLKAAVRNPNPVVFLENEILYSESFELSAEARDPNYLAPIGKAKIMRQGDHVTIVAFSKMVQYSLAAAEQLFKEGINCEVINLRSLRPLDRETILESVKKTGRVVCVEEGWPQSGISAEITALIMEGGAFKYLDAPIQRVTGVEIPTPYAFNLEAMTFPKTEQIVDAVLNVLKGAR
ncbi:unnamed protein product [Paramecium primaurelia]|uniref:Pyruvate dehydrogenase E1 component subunit beta n=1 Tax=Paramecium primaurelia TaxID=5886 RepID=A0A8S1MLE5_PARPR|nr:unnamed protein product [Paramecium primaurelia]